MEENYKELSHKEMKEFIHYISTLSENTYNLLENLLTWSRIQLNKVDLTPVEFKLQGIVDSVIRLLDNNIQKKKLTVTNKIDKNLKVYADERSIEMVLRNLLSNAVKFTPNGGRVDIFSKTIEDDKEQKPYHEICVKDTGVGIPGRHLDDLFNVATLYTTNGTNKEKGTGLGLILCKEFIEKNKGTLRIESKVGKGSKFYFTLPVGI